MQKSNPLTPNDVYTRVTNRIIELLEQGVIPWRKPWQPNGMPKNLISKRPYTGINAMLLNSLDFTSNYFLTWNQLQDIGGKVKKGEKGALIIFQTKVEKEVAKNGDVEIQRWPIVKYYTVFNVSQCVNIPDKFKEVIHEPVENINLSCEQIIYGMPRRPNIYYQGYQAYYSPKMDCIVMPKLDYFDSVTSFFNVLFHELIHSTGAIHRLARKSLCENTHFGSELYSFEELVAEIGSCYLMSIAGLGICDIANSAAYIQEWLGLLQNDNRFIIKAASQAQKAVEYILNVKPKEDKY
ncbi:ArdC family protein [Emticicia agri]|uniref:DUF1738 domain-containing protein n=1 Tax=Emticicia agri TaxID=2492393 RepID=A0A4Q5LTR5_9BACT|nr:zincin-like metallopeptidase domain-containing protein [Emticicia agri]RYU92859.1 DUF1738 domain-containing protein [Emticicia agri]